MKLWADLRFNLTDSGFFQVLLRAKLSSDTTVNQYGITYTKIQRGVSFYRHVMAIVTMVEQCKWTLQCKLTIADPRTMFKLSCRHVSTVWNSEMTLSASSTETTI